IIGDLDCPIKSGNDSARISLMQIIHLHPSSHGLTGGTSPFIPLKCNQKSKVPAKPATSDFASFGLLDFLTMPHTVYR
ncbi:MAG: hypothetical protein ABIF71_08315, partial [Planctomycetota bacterium]